MIVQIELGRYGSLELSVAIDYIADWMRQNGKTAEQIGEILREEADRVEEEIETGQF